MKRIFCISGLGADERVFSNISISGYELVHVKWIKPDNNELLQDYCKRLLPQITETSPILLGVSFGGIVSIEISKLIPTNAIIIISSITSEKEMPVWMRIVRFLKVHRYFKINPSGIFDPIQNYTLGAKTKMEKDIARNYRRNVDRTFLYWAIDVIMKWKNNYVPKNLYQIHGKDDKMFPIKHIKTSFIIEGGGHLMTYNKSKEINLVLENILKSL